MAELGEQQHEILSNMRERGLDTEAAKLQGLYAQLIERPNSEQLIELTSQMVRQYIGPPTDSTIGPVEPIKLEVSGEHSATCGVASSMFEGTPGTMGYSPASTCWGLGFGGNEEKVRIELVDFDFIIAMARVMQKGLADTYDPPRKPGDWQKYTASELEERRGSLLRHYAAGEWGSVAVNAMILWWHSKKNRNGS